MSKQVMTPTSVRRIRSLLKNQLLFVHITCCFACCGLQGRSVAAPVESLAATVEVAEAHEPGVDSGVFVWCLRLIIAAFIGTLVYHLTTVVGTKLAKRTPRERLLPVASRWRSDDGRTMMYVSGTSAHSAEIIHEPFGLQPDRRETWTVQSLRETSQGTPNILIADVVCPDHNGGIGTLFLRRGGHNDVTLDILFADSQLQPIRVRLSRS